MTLETYFDQVAKPSAAGSQSRKEDLVFTPTTSTSIPPSYLISMGYDGALRKCFLRLYDPTSHR
ncbi:MAG TPA: hypothetical protein VJZ75_02355, partial [Candidatus Bathyarchaeia archaeon]|nr:hypothetical protein [Candidatus Bathyarchaeia archaeon]